MVGGRESREAAWKVYVELRISLIASLDQPMHPCEVAENIGRLEVTLEDATRHLYGCAGEQLASDLRAAISDLRAGRVDQGRPRLLAARTAAAQLAGVDEAALE